MGTYPPRKGMTAAEINRTVSDILAEATLEEKVAMMSGHGFLEQFRTSGGLWGGDPYRTGGGCERLGVPFLHFTDGPRGVARGSSTCFPCTMARGATFSPDLERRVGEVMGIEARAQGCNLSGAVCVNLLRHPAWGRAQETYGEDPFHLGEMGAALAQGIQAHNVIATAKHFAANSIENARFKMDVRIDGRTLREVYLAHFRRIVEAGCASVMSAYNRLNGEFCGQNRELLTDILRGEWGFEGFVHSDWLLGVHQPYGAAAGLDVENPEPRAFGERLVHAVRSGAVEPAVIDTACRRILSVLYRFLSAEDPLESYGPDLIAAPAHTALAEEVALKSTVLLKNESALPLDAAQTTTLAVFGRLADLENTGDHGSSRVRPPYVITALQGLRDYLGNERTVFGGDESDPGRAAEAAARADAAVIVVGYTAREEGEYVPGDIPLTGGDQTGSAPAGDPASPERPRPRAPSGGDRDSLRLPADQVALIRAVSAANPATIVVVVAGSAVVMGEWIDGTSAVLQTFYSGMEGGRALARLLFGDVSPSGRLPFTVPASEADLPFFDKNADSIEYGPYHGYTLLEKEGKVPAFPFGFGLSYARFVYRALRVRRADGSLSVQISVRNDGDVAAEEVIQLYVGFPGIAVERPHKLLRGFQRVALSPGETVTLHFAVPHRDLAWWNPETRSWALETGSYRIYAGGSSRDEDLLVADVQL